MLAKELVDLQPDALVVSGGATTRVLQQQTQTLPIIFVQAGDAIANGLVQSMARPEGNATGISNNLPSFGGKWLDRLKDAAPDIRRVALVFNPAVTFDAYFRTIEAAAAGRGVTTIQVRVGSTPELERAIEALASEQGVGLVEVPPPLEGDQRQLMYRL